MFGYGKIDRLKRRLLLRIGMLHYWRLIGIATAVAIVHILSVREGLLTAQAAIRVNQAVILLVCLVSVGMSYARMNYFRRMARIYVRVLRKTKWAAFLKLLIWLVAAIGFTVLLVSMVSQDIRRGTMITPPPLPVHFKLLQDGVALVNAFAVGRLVVYLILAVAGRRPPDSNPVSVERKSDAAITVSRKRR